MSMTTDGIWKAGVWAQTVWADGVWSEGSASLAVIPQGGAGYPSRIDWQGKRRKATLADMPNEHLRQILDRVISEYYDEIVSSDLPRSVKKEAATIVRPYADRKSRARDIPPPVKIDWVALQRNADAVAAILQIWGDELAAKEFDLDEEDDIFMLMS